MSEDISPDVIKKTQKLLGKYVKKPPLTEKLLKKPPFRFLHDVMITVIKDTGFLKGLFSDDELKSENVKEKDTKVAFLNKLIDAVKVISKTDLAIRASKIVAGLEPTKTNLLLQAIGKAIDAKIDSSEYVAQLNLEKTDSTEKKKVKKTNASKDDKGKLSSRAKTTKDEPTPKGSKSKRSVNESPRPKTKATTPKDSSRTKIKNDKTNIKSETKSKSIEVEEPQKQVEVDNKDIVAESAIPKNTIEEADVIDSNDLNASNNNTSSEIIDTKTDEEKTEKASEISKDGIKSDTEDKVGKSATVENIQVTDSKSSSQSLSRPKSAKPKSGERAIISAKQRSPAVDQGKEKKPVEMTVNQPVQRPKSSLRPPSVRPSSARPGAPRLRPDSALPLQETVTMGSINVIVENVDVADDEETVVIQTSSEVTEENIGPIDVPLDNKGQLVEQILEQIQEEGEATKKKVDIDWEQDALHSKDGASKEINQLRTLIQTLTKTANPLGKLMNYLHEDIDAMHGELQMWNNVKKQLFSEIYKQKRLSTESNKPLLAHLEQLQEEIKKQQQEIVNVRSNILRNELRIKELLNV